MVATPEESPDDFGYAAFTFGIQRSALFSSPKMQIQIENVESGEKRMLEIPFDQPLANLPGKKFGHLGAVFKLPVGTYAVKDSVIHIPAVRTGRREFPSLDLKLSVEKNVSEFKVSSKGIRHFFAMEVTVKEAQSNAMHFYTSNSKMYFKKPGKRTWESFGPKLAELKSEFQDSKGPTSHFAPWVITAPVAKPQNSVEEKEDGEG